MVVTNRKTDHRIVWPWPERTSLADAVADVCRVMREIDPQEFRALVGSREFGVRVVADMERFRAT